MNSPLKSRFWDVQYQKFITDFAVMGNGEVYEFEEADHFPVRLYPHNGTVQRFTGMIDFNGKEIYEGDLVEKYYIREDNGVVTKSCLKGRTSDQKNPYEVTWSYQHVGFGLTKGSHHYYVVVGNIFENPELLQIASNRLNPNNQGD